MEPKIRAVNKKTGKVFEGTVQEARAFGFSDEFIVKKLQAAKDIDKAIGKTQTIDVKSPEDITKAAGDLSAGEKIQVNDAVIFSQEVKSALDKLNQAKQGGLPGASGPLTNILSGLGGAVGIDTPEAALKDQLRNLVQIIRKQRTGVAFSPQEQKELTDIFGSLKTQEGPLKRKLEDLLARSTNEISVKSGLGREQIDPLFGADQIGAEENKDKGLLYNLLVKPYQTTAGNIGALGQVGLSSLVGKFNPQAGAQIAQEGAFGQNVAERSRIASENPLQALLDQGLASADIASQAAGLKSLGGLASAGKSKVANILGKSGGKDLGQTVVNAAEKVRSMSPKSVLGGKQAAAAAESTAKPIINNFVNAGKKLAEVDPDVERLLAKQLPKLEKIKDIPTLLDRMEVWGRNAYKASGGIKGTAKGELYKEFYQEGLDQLKNLAPEVYKNRQLLRLTFELPKQFGKALWRATLGKVVLS